MGAGVVESILAVTPTETVKTKLIHDRSLQNPKYRPDSRGRLGLMRGISEIYRLEGFGGLYKGYCFY